MGRALIVGVLCVGLVSTAHARTRLYFNNASESFNPTVRGGWNDVTLDTGSELIPCKPTKAGAITSRANTESASTAPWDVLVIRCVTPPLAGAHALSGPFLLVMGARESYALMNAAYRLHIWVTQGATSNVRGSYVNQWAEDEAVHELPTSPQGWVAPRFSATTTAVNALDGDRIVIEIGARLYDNAGGLYTTTLWVGGTGTDMTNTDGGDETSETGWIELAQDIDLAFQSGNTPTPLPTDTPTVTPTGAPGTATHTPTLTPTPTATATAQATATRTATVIGRELCVTSFADAPLTADWYCADCGCNSSTNTTCTLRNAVQIARSEPTPARVYLDTPGVYEWRHGEQEVDRWVSIRGRAPLRTDITVEVSGTASERIWSTRGGGYLSLEHFTVLDSRGPFVSSTQGGCFYNAPNATLIVSDMMLRYCNNTMPQGNAELGEGGGVYNAGLFYSQNGTFWDTNTSNTGACLHNAATGTAIVDFTQFDGCRSLGLDEDGDLGYGDTAGGGAGMANFGTAYVTRSIFQYTRARLGLGGGGILNGDLFRPGGYVRLQNVTFDRDRCRLCEGGAIVSYGGQIDAYNTSIIRTQAAHLSPIVLRDGAAMHVDHVVIGLCNIDAAGDGGAFWTCYVDDTSTLTSSGVNYDDAGPNAVVPHYTCDSSFVSVDTEEDLKVALHADNGGLPGHVETVELLVDSPLIDAGSTSCGTSEDGRGMGRPYGTHCDIGAFERQPTWTPTITPTVTPTRTPTSAPSATPT